MTAWFRRRHLTILGLLALAGMTVASFQNCADLMPLPLASSLETQLEFKTANDQLIWSQLSTSPDFQVWLTAQSSALSANPLTQLLSNFVGGLTLNPATGTTGATVIPGAGGFSGKNILSFQSAQNLQTSSSESTMVGTAYTVVAVLDASATGRVISINSGAHGTEDLGITFTNPGVMKVSNATDPSDLNSMSVNLPASSGPVVIGVSFGSGASDFAVQVNGTVWPNPPVTTGTPADSSTLLRQLMIGDSTASSNLQLGELLLFSEQLTPAQLNSVSRGIADRWNVAGMGYIPYSPGGPGPTVDPLYAAVDAVFQQHHCVDCHSPGSNDGVFVGIGETALANSPYVFKGNALTSLLYERLQGYGNIGGMPLGYPQVGTNDAAAIATWINSLKP